MSVYTEKTLTESPTHAATRRMCAGTYLDPVFRNRLLREVYNDRNRRVAPSYGSDVALVLRHAWYAWWLETVQNILIAVVIIVACLRMPLDMTIVVSVLVIWYVLHLSRSWTAEFSAYYSGSRQIVNNQQLQARGKLLRRILAGAFTVLVVATLTSVARNNRPGATGAWPVRTGLLGAVAILGAFAMIVTACTVVQMICLWRLHSAGSGGLNRRSRGRIQVIREQQNHPFTVHSGFKPFIGSGNRVVNWSFAQRLIGNMETDGGNRPPPFRTSDLIGRLRKMIHELREDEHPETRLPGLTVEDKVFIEGTYAEPYSDALRAKPGSDVITEEIAKIISRPSDVARHYLASRVESWGGEIVTSVFVHVSLQGRTLYLEFATYALLPTHPGYRVIDEAGGTGIGATGKAIAKTLSALPQQLMSVRRVAWAPVQLLAALRPKKDWTISAAKRFDIGAKVSVREIAAEESDQSYFQYQDVLQHSKIIERRLIAAVGEFLTELGIDTSEFWQRAATILNNGIINTGSGSVTTTNTTFGDNSPVNPETGASQQNSGGKGA
jgi:hypothetical protein